MNIIGMSMKEYVEFMGPKNTGLMQTFYKMMGEQFDSYNAETVMLLCDGSDENVVLNNLSGVKCVYRVRPLRDKSDHDKQRYVSKYIEYKSIYANLEDMDIELPHADLLIADYMIEPLYYLYLQNIVGTVNPKFVSYMSLLSADISFLSDKPFSEVYSKVNALHHHLESEEMINAMWEIKYIRGMTDVNFIPNGKAFVRLDFIDSHFFD